MAGFSITVLPPASAATIPPMGMAQEVQGEMTSMTPFGVISPWPVRQRLHGGGVEAGVVYAFGHFHVSFDYGLAGHGTHTAYQVATRSRPDGWRHHLMRCRCSSVVLRQPAGAASYVDNLLYLFAVGLRHFANAHLVILTTVMYRWRFFAHHRFGTYLKEHDFELYRRAISSIWQDVHTHS